MNSLSLPTVNRHRVRLFWVGAWGGGGGGGFTYLIN